MKKVRVFAVGGFHGGDEPSLLVYLTRSTDPNVPLDKNFTNSVLICFNSLEEVEVTLDIEDLYLMHEVDDS